ncbi:tRNA dimethylallyltransferase 9 isoform X1 [Ananas comosus]|uniref:tRNA dimethylallyltransferase n=2 Tax=Ananas comosus TaxID=4615 RepID=A0A199VEH5_ANACO|nr:tRNA dimethylallyltransferase 9 isoform X1 [Ananas comosus]OAY75175.1 tRNA dimethylallyltransferase 9 [Ananas comosus]
MIQRLDVLPLMNGVIGLPSWSTRFMSKMRMKSPVLSPTERIPTYCSTSHCDTLTSTLSSVPNTKKTKDKVIVVSGPTGAGKSRLALELAKRLNGEIVSADSVQVYRGLDIGSAKPSIEERAEVPHHLLDILHPSEDYSAGQFFEDARKATNCIIEKGLVPIIAGGTGLYLRWYIYGKPDVPKASLEITNEVWSELVDLQKKGNWDAAVELVVKAGDPKAFNVPANDWYRLRRSLEIIRSSGSPPSAFSVPYDSFRGQAESKSADRSTDQISAVNGPGELPTKELDYDFICIFLSSPRIDLYRSIDLRCEEMLMEPEGLLTEASWLLDIGLRPNMNSATRAIGYRQAMEYLQSCRIKGGRSSPEEFYAFLSEFQKASRNFAKRQMTWFRNELIYQWIDASQPFDKVVEFICNAYCDRNERVVPEPLKMKKESTGRQESNELKSYRAKNKLFISDEDCGRVLSWIRRTQRK